MNTKSQNRAEGEDYLDGMASQVALIERLGDRLISQGRNNMRYVGTPRPMPASLEHLACEAIELASSALVAMNAHMWEEDLTDDFTEDLIRMSPEEVRDHTVMEVLDCVGILAVGSQKSMMNDDAPRKSDVRVYLSETDLNRAVTAYVEKRRSKGQLFCKDGMGWGQRMKFMCNVILEAIDSAEKDAPGEGNALSMMSSRVIHASPTMGKTTLQKALRIHGVDVADSDEIMMDMFPQAYRQKWWRSVEPGMVEEYAKVKQAVVSRMCDMMDENPNLLMFTNLWGEDTEELAYKQGIRGGLLPISFFATPALLHKRSVRRAREQGKDASNGVSLEMARKWFKDWDNKRGFSFAKSVIVTQDYLVDLIDLTGNSVMRGVPWTAIKTTVRHLAEAKQKANT